MKSTLLHAALFGAMLVLNPAAYAAQSSLTNVQLSAVDLTPDDGAAASVTLTPRPGELHASAYSASFQSSDIYPSDGLAHEINFAQPGVVAYAGQFGGGNARNEALANNPGSPYGASAFTNNVQRYTVTLAAHSQLVFSGSASASIAQPAGSAADRAEFANVLVYLFDANSPFVGPQLFGAAAYQELESGVIEGGSSTTAGGNTNSAASSLVDFLYKFDNNSDTAQLFSLNVYMMSTSNDHTTPAVPEPETYVMLGAGLLLVGGAARRRRQRG
jgi:hypothetical protein